MPEEPVEAETDPRLQRLPDTDILLNFAAALEAVYPHMRAVAAHCYDPYDDVVEPLYQALVFGSFSGKYGVTLPRGQCHTYEMEMPSYAPFHHVRVVPKRFPLEVQSSSDSFGLLEADLANRSLVFLNFGDGVHSLTGHESDGDAYDLSFHLSRFTVVDAGSRSPTAEHSWLWLPNSDLTYEFVERAA